ncbi:nitronate monooxygenase [Allopusillimonas soli]|uniref:Nitronate monooxygenase n=1 Tax=Allopusillimonas soli TaxID=659016 RepID=A0A853FEW4_9BURK|nr:nitronate monooxygenase [Allopusillimonas soli]NYT38429.1 nitronate monooxygenase [Allopusillimonas soli]TEA72014.1 nitronate monooxygenase [Allopusillimonas soli]
MNAAIETAFTTPLCRRLRVRFPIFGFSHSVDVCVAIARAGGFPVVGLAREMPEEIPDIIKSLERKMQGMPYGIDLMLPGGVPEHGNHASLQEALPIEQRNFVSALRQRFEIKPPSQPSFFTTQVRTQALFDQQIEQVLASNATAIATAIGLRADLIVRAKAAGKMTFSLIGSPRHAAKALDMGVDVLVAQGYDAGGHTGPIGTMSLIPQIVELAGDTPVLAAGGIATGGQILGSMAMGAQGAWLGTLWMAAKENHTPSALLERLVNAASDDTVVTRAHSGKPCRVVRSAWIDAWEQTDAPAPLPMPFQQVLTGDVFTSIHETNDNRLIYEAAGQSLFAIRGQTTIAAQFEQLVSEMREAWLSLQPWAGGETSA